MTARSSSAEAQRADQVRDRVIGNAQLLGRLWDLMSPEERHAVATLQPYADLGYATSLTWDEIEARDRARLVSGFRHLMGLSSLAEAALR